MQVELFEKQHQNLVKMVKNYPFLGDVIFQGKPLSWHASKTGLNKLLEAVENEWLDPIALNHSIRRYCIDKYASDLVWDYPGIDKGISFDDSFIRDLNINFLKIKSEVLNIIDSLKEFPDSDDLTNKNGQWNYIPFFEKDGTPVDNVLNQCPNVTSLISKQNINTDLGFVFVSALTSRSTISAHCGSTALRKRYHLPIQVPVVGESKIRIGTEWVSWIPGQPFSFYDAVEHEVVHNSDGDRILLIVDVWPEALPTELTKFLSENKDILRYATDNRDSVALND